VRLVSETVPRRDAGPELTGTYSQRVSETNLTTRVRSAAIPDMQISSVVSSTPCGFLVTVYP